MSAKEKVLAKASREKVARLAATYSLHSRPYRGLAEAWKARTGEPLPEGARASLARSKSRAASELWEAAPKRLAHEFPALRLRRVAAAAVHPDAWRSLNVGLKQRADRWQGDSPETVRNRWLDQAALEALADKGPPPGPWAPAWYRRWSNRVGQVLKRELKHPPAPPAEAEVDEDARELALAARVVEAWRTRDPLEEDRDLLRYLQREHFDEEERALVAVMQETGPNVRAASDKLGWSYWRARRVFKQVKAKGRAAKAAWR